MKIGIDISQVAYERTGVAKSVSKLVENMLEKDKKNQYVFFFSSLRGNIPADFRKKLSAGENVELRTFKIPQRLLTFLWNKTHVIPIEWLIGKMDIFISSDWTEPPVKKTKKITFIHDMTPFLFPNETDASLIKNHKLKLAWSKKECAAFICPSESTRNDAIRLLNLSPDKVKVVAWGKL